jgi:hypothetical protein
MAGERDGSTIRRHRRFTPLAGLRDELANVSAGDVDDVEMRRLVLHVRVRRSVAVEHDRLAVGRPVDRRAAAQLAGADAPVAGRQVARRAAFGGHDEQVGKPLVEEADLILPVMQRPDDAGGRRPFGPLRLGRHADRPFFLVRREHRERDRFPVRRPARVARRRVGHARNLRGRALGIHPSHEQLPAFRLAFCEVQQPLAVGRPARRRSFDQKPMLRSIRVENPQRGLPFVLELVHVPARVNDARPVGRDLRVGHTLPIKIVLGGEERIRARLLGAQHGGAASDDGGEQRRTDRS